MKALLLVFTIIIAIRAEYVLEELKRNDCVEEINKVPLYHEEWRLIIIINLTTTEHTLILAERACGTSCAPKEELKLVKGKYIRLASKTVVGKILPRGSPSRRGGLSQNLVAVPAVAKKVQPATDASFIRWFEYRGLKFKTKNS